MTILPGVIIGKKAVISIESVVVKSLQGNAIYVGILEKLIKEIILLICKIRKLKFYGFLNIKIK